MSALKSYHLTHTDSRTKDTAEQVRLAVELLHSYEQPAAILADNPTAVVALIVDTVDNLQYSVTATFGIVTVVSAPADPHLVHDGTECVTVEETGGAGVLLLAAAILGKARAAGWPTVEDMHARHNTGDAVADDNGFTHEDKNFTRRAAAPSVATHTAAEVIAEELEREVGPNYAVQTFDGLDDLDETAAAIYARRPKLNESGK